MTGAIPWYSGAWSRYRAREIFTRGDPMFDFGLMIFLPLAVALVLSAVLLLLSR